MAARNSAGFSWARMLTATGKVGKGTKDMWDHAVAVLTRGGKWMMGLVMKARAVAEKAQTTTPRSGETPAPNGQHVKRVAV